MSNIADEVRLIVATHVDQLTQLRQQGRLVDTSDIVNLVAHSYESTSDKQLRDYVSYRLREEAHVCRYARGTARGQRFVHVERECSTACKAIDVHNQKPNNTAAGELVPRAHKIPSGNCPTCNMIVPNGAECGICA
jgi:hypothetical protein